MAEEKDLIEQDVAEVQPETDAVEGDAEVTALEGEATVSKEDYDALDGRYVRLLADFDNFKRRTAQEKQDIRHYSNMDLIKELLPILDSFDLALSQNAGDAQANMASYYEGMDQIRKQLMTVLEQAGLERITACHKPFDPVYHEAVMMVDDADVPPQTVVDEMRAGYIYKGKVLRPTVCRVAQG